MLSVATRSSEPAYIIKNDAEAIEVAKKLAAELPRALPFATATGSGR
jgi:hypothetical protein